MSQTINVPRELLERLLYVMDNYVTHETPEEDQLRAILAAPRQPEGEGLEVVGWYHSHAEVATSDKARVVQWLPECIEPLCRLSDAKRAIAELREEISDLHTTMMAAAVEIQEHWQSHCDEEGYGPANLIRRLERGIAAQYGYTAQSLVQIQAERDTLRQQLAEARDEITQHSNDLTLAYMKGGADMRQQMDNLAGLLREVGDWIDRTSFHGTDAVDLMQRIDAALAEVKP